MQLSAGQFDKLAELFLDIAKGALLASFIAPAIVQVSGIIFLVRSLTIGVMLTLLSLKTIALKEAKL